MNALRKMMLGLANDQRGGALVEYVIVVALVAAVAVSAWQTFGDDVRRNLTDAGDKINTELEKSPSE